MKRYPAIIWLGIICGYFLEDAYHAVFSIVQMFWMLCSHSSSYGGIVIASMSSMIGLAEGFIAVQLMLRKTDAIIYGILVVVIHIVITLGSFFSQMFHIRVYSSQTGILGQIAINAVGAIILQIIILVILFHLERVKQSIDTQKP